MGKFERKFPFVFPDFNADVLSFEFFDDRLENLLGLDIGEDAVVLGLGANVAAHDWLDYSLSFVGYLLLIGCEFTIHVKFAIVLQSASSSPLFFFLSQELLLNTVVDDVESILKFLLNLGIGGGWSLKPWVSDYVG